MEEWIEEERQCTLHTEPRPSPSYPEVGVNDIAAEVAPSLIEALEQPPPINAEKKAVTSNPPPNMEELANEVTSGFTGGAALINLEEEGELAATVDNNLPSA